MKRIAAIMMIALMIPLSAVAGENLEDPADVAEAFHKAMKSGNKDKVLAFFDPELSVFESGNAETSLEEYASHHLEADLEFNSSTKRKVTDQNVVVLGDTAWIMTSSTTKGKFRGTRIDISGVETMNLVRRPEGWRIVHIHMSHKINK